ncbi:L,D-transpeptidase family protein [Streptomyces parvus]|uniref:L,D-TPase catalytic domain-containing protein n=1 Tax=Streptomyces parvus TaxID=66428 RepID=A0A5D4JL11_9ACTN|nr:L,D-transpeptidase family protein [Streptomyces parvus]TYR65029.1 hypothetical protein FY004_08550 [Streptomyces parvus]
MRRSLVTAAVLLALAGSLGAAPADASDVPPLPDRLADTGGGTQLITAEATDTGSTTGTVTWWERRGGRWAEAGSAPARFGANGLAEGATREQGTSTTPTGLFDLPYAFGIEDAPAGTTYPYRKVNEDSWWCQDNDSVAYNRWVEPRPAHCRAAEAEHLVSYGTQYARALVIGFNYEQPVRNRGAGIFLHVNGRGATAGCVSVPADAMAEILAWADPEREPHIAVGTTSGPTAITRH